MRRSSFDAPGTLWEESLGSGWKLLAGSLPQFTGALTKLSRGLSHKAIIGFAKVSVKQVSKSQLCVCVYVCGWVCVYVCARVCTCACVCWGRGMQKEIEKHLSNLVMCVLESRDLNQNPALNAS